MSPLPCVILVRPQMGENIGAVARAMSNFGLHELRLVAPRDGWPNPKALEMASGASDIIESAQVFASFSEAMHDVAVAYATTARMRDIAKPGLAPEQAVAALKGELAAGRGCALVFGPERTGLENDEIVLCDALVHIPTHPANPSLNLAQAMIVVGYEWFKAGAKLPKGDGREMASKLELQGFFDQLEGELDAVDYFRVEQKKPVMWRNLQNMFVRARLDSQEVRTLRGMVRSLRRRDIDER